MTTYRPVLRGRIGNSIFVEIHDPATPFLPKTGLAFNTAGILFYYVKKGAAAVAITPVTLAALTTVWTSGGVKEVDAANMQGLYRLDIPDAAFTDDGLSDEVNICISATGYAFTNVKIPLTDREEVFINRGGVRVNS